MTCFLCCLLNNGYLEKALESIYPQIIKYKEKGKPLFYIINNTLEKLNIDIKYDYFIYNSPVPLNFSQSINYAFRENDKNDFMLWSHIDVTLNDNALDSLYNKYIEVKNKKWYQVRTNYDSFAIYNHKVFLENNILYDELLFPLYFNDKHAYRLMELRGYNFFETNENLVNHHTGMSIKTNKTIGRKNKMMFEEQGFVYKKIWGGFPGEETITDPNANGVI